jgi:hypothetical protein
MHVRLKTAQIRVPGPSNEAGDVVDLPECEAAELIRRHEAELETRDGTPARPPALKRRKDARNV